MRNVKTKGQGATRGGFTLIELLVAMAILMIIVLIVAQVFQQARQAWATGTRRSEMNMRGRALADYISQELGGAIPGHDPFLPPPGSKSSSATFYVLGDAANGARAAQQVTYALDGWTITRRSTVTGANPIPMCDASVTNLLFTSAAGDANEMPLYVDVQVTVSDGKTNKVFESRAVMVNRKRNSMD